MASRQTVFGTVRWFNPQKGYGFIQREDGGEDLFFHESDLATKLTPSEGDRVRFHIERGNRGPRAADVRRARGRGGSGAKPAKPRSGRRPRTEDSGRERSSVPSSASSAGDSAPPATSFTYTIYSRGYDRTSQESESETED